MLFNFVFLWDLFSVCVCFLCFSFVCGYSWFLYLLILFSKDREKEVELNEDKMVRICRRWGWERGDKYILCEFLNKRRIGCWYSLRAWKNSTLNPSRSMHFSTKDFYYYLLPMLPNIVYKCLFTWRGIWYRYK